MTWLAGEVYSVRIEYLFSYLHQQRTFFCPCLVHGRFATCWDFLGEGNAHKVTWRRSWQSWHNEGSKNVDFLPYFSKNGKTSGFTRFNSLLQIWDLHGLWPEPLLDFTGRPWRVPRWFCDVLKLPQGPSEGKESCETVEICWYALNHSKTQSICMFHHVNIRWTAIPSGWNNLFSKVWNGDLLHYTCIIPMPSLHQPDGTTGQKGLWMSPWHHDFSVSHEVPAAASRWTCRLFDSYHHVTGQWEHISGLKICNIMDHANLIWKFLL